MPSIRIPAPAPLLRTTACLAKFDEHWPEVEAAAALDLQFDRGTLGTVLVSARAEYRTPIEMVGAKGVIRAADGLTVEHPITIEILHGGKVVHSEEVNNAGAYSRQVDAFALALRGEEPFPATAEDGLRNQLVLDEAYRRIENTGAQL